MWTVDLEEYYGYNLHTIYHNNTNADCSVATSVMPIAIYHAVTYVVVIPWTQVVYLYTRSPRTEGVHIR